ncbi:hypothetical protein [Foetidibacter luteolus]|uniref:hypothetical protein n=1 Tax=Foetidibacter luteolus TaxID=2608880 RepID=UPI00129B5DF6|nr:hypothetical protein [Foetidibacter luteolus]
MKLYKPVIVGNSIAFASLALVLGMFGFAGVGAAAFCIVFIDLFVLLVYIFTKNMAAVKATLLCIGVLLLTGFSICSVSNGVG